MRPGARNPLHWGLERATDTPGVGKIGYVGVARWNTTLKKFQRSNIGMPGCHVGGRTKRWQVISPHDLYDITSTIGYETQGTVALRETDTTVTLGDMADPNLEPLVSCR